VTEYTLELESKRVRSGWRVLVERVVTGLAVVLLVAWSWLWLPPMFAGVRAQTELGQSGWSHLPSAHQAFEVVFVAGYWGVRWLPGVVLLAVVVSVARRWLRRGA